MKQGIKCCSKCTRNLSVTHFYKNRSERDGLQRWCKDCTRQVTKDTKQNKQALINQIKLGSGCVDCGYNLHPAALEFDHLPGFEKVDKISSIFTKSGSWDLVMAEIAKCEVVCANCHRIRTADRRNNDGA